VSHDWGMLQDGDIALIRARWWLRWLCTYDHAAIVWRRQRAPDVWDYYTVEAGMTGVRSWVMGNWGRDITVIRPITPDNERGRSLGYQAANEALRLQGLVYAWGHLARVIGQLLRRKLLRIQTGVVCSEFAALAWRLVGVDLCPGVREPSPDDLHLAVEARRATVVANYLY